MSTLKEKQETGKQELSWKRQHGVVGPPQKLEQSLFTNSASCAGIAEEGTGKMIIYELTEQY